MGKPTRIFDRLPNDAGVTFEGFEEIRIKSRESVKSKLEEFMEYCKDAKKPAIRVILGEWGEGKTDAYKRYIQPKSQKEGNYAFFVSASTLSNGYEVPYIKKLLERTSLSAVRFLVVLFSCVREELKEVKIPEVGKYEDPYAYLNDVLANLIGEKKTQRIFIFIDEFEELLLNPPRLRDIISGIKETINGRFTAIDENGKYEGCVHLIIAATPDAFYRLQVDEETSLIFGGLGRRVGVIDLPQISKQEGIEFLYALLKYSYKNNLPQPLPFDNMGVFHTLFRITQGNPGNLVSLFARLMNSARIGHDQIKNIDSEHLLKFLEKEQVFIYGGTTPCLETETLFRILKIVEEQKAKEIGQKCGILLKVLCGELKPFSIEELKNRIGYIKDIKNLISIINNDLRSREGIKRAVLKVSPLREGKSFNDVIEAFKEYITMEKEKKYIKIENYSESLNEFKDRITYFSIDENKIIPQIYLPSERYSIMSFLEGITLEKAIEIENLINRRLCKDEDYYLISEELLSRIFPIPVPRELEFIKNRELRMKLWREITKNLAEQYELYMPKALMNLLEKSGLFKLEEKHVPRSNARVAELIINGIKINSLFYSVNGDVKTQDIEELNSLIKGMVPPIHCAILLYTGEVTPEAEDKIINKELGKEGENIILEVHLHPTLLKRIISIHRMSFKPEEINESLFISMIKKIVTQELDFQNKLKEWLNSQEKRGVFIPDLLLKATSNPKELAEALKFYINFMEEENTIQEIFNKNKNELQRFIKYEAKKVGLIPDIELPKFIRLSEDLESNGFLIKSGDKYSLHPHIVEKRILNILKRKTRLLENELESYFIEEKARLLKDVFLPILEYKGLIRREWNSYSLNDRRQLVNEIEQEIRRFKQLIQTEKYHEYGYIFMTKTEERGYRFIALREFEDLVEKIYQKTYELTEIDEEIILQKLSLLKRLLQHFKEEFIPLIKNAKDKIENILIDVRSIQTNLKDRIEQMKIECNNWLKLNFNAENVEEYKKIESILKNIEEYSKYEYEDIAKIVNDKFVNNDEILKKFYFRRDEEEAFYFNPKLYLIALKKDEFDQNYKTIEQILEELNVLFRDLNKRQNQIEREINKKTISESNKMSNSILKILAQLIKNVSPKIQPISFETISLLEIKKYVEQEMSSIKLNLDNIVGRLTRLDELNAREEEVLSLFKESKELSHHVLSVFDIKEYDMIANKFKLIVDEIINEYNKSLESIVFQDAQSLLQTMNNLILILDDFEGRIKREELSIKESWFKYSRELQNYIDNIDFILRLLEKRYNVNIKEFITELKEIQKDINVDHVRKVKLKLSEIEQKKNQIHQKLYEIIKPILDEKELQILELVVKKIRLEKKEWLPNQELYKIAKEKMGIQSREVEEILQKLTEKGLFRKGISLSF
ncbi:MAG: hypothetical protein QXI49_06770 [Candidatus Methanomethylicaceae archaeon]